MIHSPTLKRHRQMQFQQVTWCNISEFSYAYALKPRQIYLTNQNLKLNNEFYFS